MERVKKTTLDDSLSLEVIEFIKKAHEGQVRRFSYAPYWTHPIRVATLVMKYKASHQIDGLVTAALLHDVVEDTSISLEDIKNNYGDFVWSLVDELTSNKDKIKEIGKAVYLENKMVHMTSWALVIKLCDRLDNVQDFLYAPQKFIDKYAKETYSILYGLRTRRTLSDTHIEIIHEIEHYLNRYWKG